MPRLLIAAVAASLVIAIGVAMLGRSPNPAIVGASSSQAPSAPSSSSPGSSAAPSAAADVPAVLRQDWQADVTEPLPNLGAHDDRIQLSFGFDTSEAWIQTGVFTNQNVVLRGGASAPGASMVRLASTSADGGCEVGDVGRYNWAISGNGLFLTLAGLTDECPVRRRTLERTWVHSLAARNLGGPGVLSYFQPSIQMTLPPGNWSAGGVSTAADVASDAGLNVIAIQDPAGFSDPCGTNGGTHISVAPTIAAYSAYLRSIPAFRVTSTSERIDGKKAVHLAIDTTKASKCDGKRILEFAPNDLSNTTYWFISQGDPDTVWLVEVGSHLYMLQWIGPDQTLADERAVMATIRFIDKLPTP